ncbi:MAG TPA: hypothetical protein VGD43_24345 [Micromonospora sp.]
MDVSLSIPVTELDATTPRLDVCARHGRPVAKRINFVLQSRPRLESNVALSGNVAATTGRVAEHARKVKVTRVSGWPLCATCVRTRILWVTIAAICFWGGLLAFAGAVVARLVIGHPSTALSIPLYAGIVGVIASPAPFVLGSVPRVINARTSDDGSAVVVRDPDPRFAEQVRAAAHRTA